MSYFEIIKRYMHFRKKTSVGNSGSLVRLTIKIVLLIVLATFLILLVDRINFPHPQKNIEKKISNENFKVVK